jgi:prepilin-type N-terminal cleavage/methylation domain-containing protein
MRFWRQLSMRLGERRGYSLLEVLIGMVILAIALASAFAMSVANARLMERNQNISAASSLAECKLEELRNQSFDSIVTGSDESPLNALGQPDSGGIYTRSWAVSGGAPSFASADLKTVIVVVGWNRWGEAQTFTLTGVIGR